MNRARKEHAKSTKYLSSYYQVDLIKHPIKELRQAPCSIAFTGEDFKAVHHPHNGALVVSMTVANYNVRRILVDNGNSADILYWDAFKRMSIATDKL